MKLGPVYPARRASPAKKKQKTDEADDAEEESSVFRIQTTAMLLTYHIREFTEENLVEMQTHFMELYPNAKISLALELTKEGETHQHVYLQNDKKIDCALTHFDYSGSPAVDCQSNRVKGSGFNTACDRGHFYLQCKYKIGSVVRKTNHEIMQVKQQWIMTLFQSGKIEIEDVVDCSGEYNCLTVPGKRDMECLIAQKREMKTRVKRQQVKEYLDTTLVEFKSYAEIDKWKEQYLTMLTRYKFLVIYGTKSNTGKTELAKSLFKNPHIMRGSIDWKPYDDEKHDAIIFDDIKGLNIYSYVSDNRALFQAGCDTYPVHTTSNGGANAYAFNVYVYQKPMIITTNFPVMKEYKGYPTWVYQNCHILHITCDTHYKNTPKEHVIEQVYAKDGVDADGKFVGFYKN
jgi:hypothetical protein